MYKNSDYIGKITTYSSKKIKNNLYFKISKCLNNNVIVLRMTICLIISFRCFYKIVSNSKLQSLMPNVKMWFF